MRYQLRIIAGQLRGRKVVVTLHPSLRPMADRAREALFSILGDRITGRPFFDVFAGSGAVGLEALSRGAGPVTFVELDPRSAGEIARHLETFHVTERAHVLRADAYRWADKMPAPQGPVTVFCGPPYQEFENHFDAITWLVTTLQAKLPTGSTVIVQSDRTFNAESLPDAAHWDVRHYGRTQLAIWHQAEQNQLAVADQPK
jgi:16S rRNA (guanine(966)-N(2))-methyltransferase RsmD